MELEVRPKYLVADTNCYIDHLDAVVRLTHEKHYTLIAPLVGMCAHDTLVFSSFTSHVISTFIFFFLLFSPSSPFLPLSLSFFSISYTPVVSFKRENVYLLHSFYFYIFKEGAFSSSSSSSFLLFTTWVVQLVFLIFVMEEEEEEGVLSSS